MSFFGWRSDAIIALKICNDELRRMHKFLYADISDIDITKTEIMDIITKLQGTMNEVVRKPNGK